jgi:hypothetical protein
MAYKKIRYAREHGFSLAKPGIASAEQALQIAFVEVPFYTALKPSAIFIESRTHRSPNKDAPVHRAISSLGAVISRLVLGGLLHQYCRI